MSDSVIQVENLSKKYTIRHEQRERYTTLRDVLTNKFKSVGKRVIRPFTFHHSPFTDSSREEFWALKDVSFEVNQGDRIGIIGRNGAGKTTLLKILSRITEPTNGRIKIKGRVASLLEVGTGFHPELTGRENIFLNGAILGMSKNEIKKKFDGIVDFAEIDKFLDTPVKRYSSGMYVRLAFAVAAHLEPEILLVDEVLAVGDAQFQKKCLGKMEDVSMKEGRTILFVSHNMGAIRQVCSEGFWIDQGRIVTSGSANKIVDDYLKNDQSVGNGAEKHFQDDATKEFQLLSVRLLNKYGEVTQNFDCNGPIIIELICKVYRQTPGLYGYLVISRTDGTLVIEGDTYDGGNNPLDNLEQGLHTFMITVPPRTIGVGDYTVYLNFTSHMGIKGFTIDSPGTVCTFHLSDNESRRGNYRRGFFSMLLPWKQIDMKGEKNNA